MAHSNTYLKALKGETLLQMFAEDGASAPGNAPPAKYLRAVQNAESAEVVDAVREAHGKGVDPPGQSSNNPPGN